MADYNITLVILSYIVAVIGSLMALVITRNALLRPADDRKGLIILASLCLGGVGIWSMHFIGMLAFHIEAMPVNYNWWLTALSLLVGMVVVYIGLALMSTGEFRYFKLVLAGIVVGLGVAAMHYTGMLAMRVQADVEWNWAIIALSIGIAVAASIVALWLATHVKLMWQITASALVMGVAVCGMHYTGMTAVSFVHNADLPQISTMIVSTSIFSLIITAFDSMIVVLAMMVAMIEANRSKFITV
ncbi:MAG: hypothetical protein CVV13_13545 [Gammaproteobacteria bacterium HGW-Gammaproteobacteria-3]|nr:MAG: hypothetical protein CVV13_13545 [Gammaproteobacteria bacterium HGW-Gammaproteobacteria-3]